MSDQLILIQQYNVMQQMAVAMQTLHKVILDMANTIKTSLIDTIKTFASKLIQANIMIAKYSEMLRKSEDIAKANKTRGTNNDVNSIIVKINKLKERGQDIEPRNIKSQQPIPLEPPDTTKKKKEDFTFSEFQKALNSLSQKMMGTYKTPDMIKAEKKEAKKAQAQQTSDDSGLLDYIEANSGVEFGAGMKRPQGKKKQLQEGAENAKFAFSPLTQLGAVMKKQISPGLQEFQKTGKSMTSMYLVSQPIMAFFSGFFSIFEPIIDIFTMFGEILGTAFQPIVQAIVEIMIQFMPYILEVVDALSPVFEILATVLLSLFEIIKPILPIITDLIRLFADLVATVLNVIMNIPGLSSLLDGLVYVLGLVSDAISTFIGWLETLVGWLGDIVNNEGFAQDKFWNPFGWGRGGATKWEF